MDAQHGEPFDALFDPALQAEALANDQRLQAGLDTQIGLVAGLSIQHCVDLPGRFSNPRPALRTLISRLLKETQGLGARSRTPERHDTRGPMAKNSAKSQTRLRPTRQAELIADYVAGMPVKAISEKYSVHRGTILDAVRRAGITVRVVGLDTDERARASSLYVGGMTLMQVARRIGIGDEAVRQAVLDAGGQIRPRGRRPRCPAIHA